MLNDGIVSYLHNVENGASEEKLEEQKLALEGDWAALKSYLQESQYYDVVTKLSAGFIDYDQTQQLQEQHHVLDNHLPLKKGRIN